MVQPFGEEERSHINSQLRYQNGYDSGDIIAYGKPVEGGIDLSKAPQIAGVIDQVTTFAGVRPDCVHMMTREGGQLHTSHVDKMKFDARVVVHLGAGTLLRGESDSNSSTGDLVLSGGGLRRPLRMKMRGRDAYMAVGKTVLGGPGFHGVMSADEASLSVVCTFTRGKLFNVFRSESIPLATNFPSLGGVQAVDGEEAFCVAASGDVPPKCLKERIRKAGDFTEGVSLFRPPPETRASRFHWLGKHHGSNGGKRSANSLISVESMVTFR